VGAFYYFVRAHNKSQLGACASLVDAVESTRLPAAEAVDRRIAGPPVNGAQQDSA
jgi:hypothetical protein